MASDPAEHVCFAAYLDALAEIPDHGERDLLGLVLSDADQVMAESAVMRHLDRKAPSFSEEDDYVRWCDRIGGALQGHALPERRLREWSLLRAISTDGDWIRAHLVDASDWLQLPV